MNLIITVTAQDGHQSYRAKVHIDPLMLDVFEPIETTDDLRLSLVIGTPLPSSVSVVRRRQLRKDAAERLAASLTEVLVDAMSANDTHNGYPTS